MFVFDVETLGKRSNSVILSFAAVYFNPDDKPDHHALRKDAFFAKLSVEEQVKEWGREINRPTLDWWAKQCLNARQASVNRDPSRDELFMDAYKRLGEWADSKNDPKCWVWARGNLDQLILDDIEEQHGIEKPVFYFNRWRDVRTAIDFLYSTTTGYCDIDYPGFDPALDITKHNPIDDCIYDAMMLMYGKKS